MRGLHIKYKHEILVLHINHKTYIKYIYKPNCIDVYKHVNLFDFVIAIASVDVQKFTFSIRFSFVISDSQLSSLIRHCQTV